MTQEQKQDSIALTKELAKRVAIEVGIAVAVHFVAKAVIKTFEK